MTLRRSLRWAALAGGLIVPAAACSSFDAEPSGAPSAEAGPGTDGTAPVGDGASPDGATAADGGPCSVGAAPAEFVKTTGTPAELASDGAWIYWVESQKDIVRAARNTCVKQPVFQASSVTALAADTSWVVWGQPAYRAIEPSTIGGAPTPRTHAAELDRSLVVHGNTSYWADPFSKIAACDNPCESTSVASGLVDVHNRLLAANSSALYFFGTAPAVTANSLWTRPFGALSTVAGPLAAANDVTLLAASDTRVYWASSTGAITSRIIAGGAGTNGTVVGATALAASDKFVYVATNTSIVRIPAGGADPIPMASDQKDITSMLLVGDELYWATAGDATIRRMNAN